MRLQQNFTPSAFSWPSSGEQIWMPVTEKTGLIVCEFWFQMLCFWGKKTINILKAINVSIIFICYHVGFTRSNGEKIDPTFQLPNPKKCSYVQFNSEYLAYNFFLSFNNLKYHSWNKMHCKGPDWNIVRRRCHIRIQQFCIPRQWCFPKTGSWRWDLK